MFYFQQHVPIQHVGQAPRCWYVLIVSKDDGDIKHLYSSITAAPRVECRTILAFGNNRKSYHHVHNVDDETNKYPGRE